MDRKDLREEARIADLPEDQYIRCVQVTRLTKQLEVLRVITISIPVILAGLLVKNLFPVLESVGATIGAFLTGIVYWALIERWIAKINDEVDSDRTELTKIMVQRDRQKQVR